MDDWTEEVADDDVRCVTTPHGHRPRRGRPRRRCADLARRLEGASKPVLVAGPDVDASGAWDLAIALAEKQRLGVWASPAPGGGRLGFPEGHPNFQGTLPPGIGAVASTLEGDDLILVVGSSVFPYYPYIPGPPLPEGAELVAITSDPDEAARAPMGDAIVADVKLTLASAAGRGRRRATASRRRPSATRRRSRTPTRSAPAPCTRRSTRRCPTTASSCSSRRRARWRCATGCGSRGPGSYYFCAGGGLGYGLQRRHRRAARPARPPGGLRARRGLGPVRGVGLLDGGRLPACRSRS